MWNEGEKKPWVINTSGGYKFDLARRCLRDAGLPVFDSCDRACRALVNLLRAWIGRYGFLE